MLLLHFYRDSMFEYKDGLQFINIDTDYIKTLSVACPEVSYKDIGYDRKPYIGVLVQNGDNNAKNSQ